MTKGFPFLREKIALGGEIELRTGLHIGGGDVGLRIGGIDKVVVRSPKDDTPYVPGSSLRGKMRSLLERAAYAKGFPQINKGMEGSPCSCAKAGCLVCRVFGVPAKDAARECGTTRLIVRDAALLNADELKRWRFLDGNYTESKTEVAIDRLTSQANPRTFERVPAGARFGLDIVLNVHEGDDAEAHLDLVFAGLELVSYDSLGGQGSRGYGAVTIRVNSLHVLDVQNLASESEKAWRNAPFQKRTLPWTVPVQEARP